MTGTRKPVKLLVVGSVNLDFVITAKSLPAPGETVTGGAFTTTPGGKGANQALAARRLGADVTLCARVGTDAYAQAALSNLHADGVDLSAVSRSETAPTGAAFIVVAGDGENQIAVASGANYELAPAHVPDCAADAVLAQLETPQAATLKAVENRDVFFALNAAPMAPIGPALLARADLLIVNEGEYDALKKDAPDAMAQFKGLLAVTLGGEGAILSRAGVELARARPPQVVVMDTTGAGDCFSAALTTALAASAAPEDALTQACAAGALATTRLGAQSALPKQSEVEKIL